MSKKGEETKARLIVLAQQTLSVEGIKGTSLDQLVRNAGLSKGAFFAHFRSKGDLLEHVVDEATGLFEERVLAAYASGSGAIGHLNAGARAYQDYIFEEIYAGGCLLLNLSLEADDTDAKLARQITTVFDRWRALIVKTVEAGIDDGEIKPEARSEQIGHFTVAALSGAAMLWKQNKLDEGFAGVVVGLEESYRLLRRP